MKRALLLGLSILMLLTVPAAVASAHEFKASKTGSLTGSTTTEAAFTVAAGKFICKETNMSGTLGTLTAKQLVEKYTYGGCQFAGVKATVSEAEYEWSAEGTLTVLNKIVLTGHECTITIEPSSNKGLKAVKYTNELGQVKITPEVTGITYLAKGLCTGGSAGTLTGPLSTSLAGGSIEWK